MLVKIFVSASLVAHRSFHSPRHIISVVALVLDEFKRTMLEVCDSRWKKEEFLFHVLKSAPAFLPVLCLQPV